MMCRILCLLMETSLLLSCSTVGDYQPYVPPMAKIEVVEVEKIVYQDRIINVGNDSKLIEENALLRKQQENERLANRKILEELEAKLNEQTSSSSSHHKIGIINKGFRTALIIGNSNYRSSPLKNPVNDASDLADTLLYLGFEIKIITDANKKQMGKAISKFGKKLKKGGVGLFYYAGHGIQIDGINYLIPIGADPEEEEDLKYDSINAGEILSKMDTAGNDLNIVIMDACRNNPFSRSWRSGNRGLARVEAPTGSLIIYATGSGKVASDGKGRNGTFTKHLLKAITLLNIELMSAIKQTRIGVMGETNNMQVPWVSEATTKEFYFAGQTKPF